MKFKTKLILAGVSLSMALIMLVTASLAWFTISTAPEIGGIHVGIKAQRTLLLSRDTEELDFQQYIDLSNDFAYLVPLRPVSTVDGRNWFIPQYDSGTGALLNPDEFILDTTLQYANVTTLAGTNGDIHDRSSMYDPNYPGALKDPADITELDGFALRNRSDLGYYVYADFWMTTEEDNGCKVRLTIPHTNDLEEEETDQGQYGSYVLQTYELVDDDNANVAEGEEKPKKVALLSRNAETSMRVGMLLNPDEDTKDAITAINDSGSEDEDFVELDPEAYSGVKDEFFIYEPNANHRSASNKPLAGEPEDEDSTGLTGEKVDYVVGYKFNQDSYKPDTYFATEPIMAVEKTRTNPDTGEEETYTGGTPVDVQSVATTHLLIQNASSWDLTKVQKKLKDGLQPNSNDVNYPMGGFLNTTKVYDALGTDSYSDTEHPEKSFENVSRIADISAGKDAGKTDIAGSSVIVQLKKDTPLKIRLFIWIEGQDVDCWNDIAAGSFIVNLELAGESLPDPS